MNKLVRIIVVLALVIGLVGLWLNLPADSVYSAGTTTLTLYQYSDASEEGWTFGTPDYWTNMTDSASPTETDVYALGWSTGVVSNKFTTRWLCDTFDISSLPAGVEILSVTYRKYVDSNYTGAYDYAGWSQYYSVYSGQPSDPENLQASDGRRWWYGTDVTRVTSEIVDYDDVSAGSVWMEFPILDLKTGDFDYIEDDADDFVHFYLMTTNHAMKSAPYWPGGGYQRGINVHGYDSANKAQLLIEYVTPPNTRSVTHESNDSVDLSTDGSEVCDNITWGTPRCMYADDDGLYLLVNGDSGAYFTGGLVDDDGETLETVDDSVRTDGNYDWWIDDISSYGGKYVRAWVLTDNVSERLWSEWAHVADAPDDDERTNDIYSLDTEYPQYDNEFSDYVVQEGDYMFIHWKTNIDGTANETMDYNLSIRRNGQADDNVFNLSLYTMWEDYFEGTEANAQNLLHWRYAIFAMDDTGSGYQDYDGLVIVLDEPLIASNKGFYQPVIYDNTDNVTLLTTTHSAYWYLDSAGEGAILDLANDNMPQGDNLEALVDIGNAGRIYTYLPDLTLSTVGSGGYSGGGTVVSGHNSFEIGSIAIGSYELRFQFTGGTVENYAMIFDMPFEVSESGSVESGEGLFGGISGWLSARGLDNQTGHWVVVIVAMFLLFIVCFRSPVLRVVLPLMVLGLAIVSGWLETWVVVLLALAAGGVVAAIFKKKLGGG